MVLVIRCNVDFNEMYLLRGDANTNHKIFFVLPNVIVPICVSNK